MLQNFLVSFSAVFIEYTINFFDEAISYTIIFNSQFIFIIFILSIY